MSSVIPAVTATSIKHCLLIDIVVNTTTYYISNAYSPITYNGNTYSQLGHFMSMSEIQDDLKITFRSKALMVNQEKDSRWMENS
jgi:hypothetical protein